MLLRSHFQFFLTYAPPLGTNSVSSLSYWHGFIKDTLELHWLLWETNLPIQAPLRPLPSYHLCPSFPLSPALMFPSVPMTPLIWEGSQVPTSSIPLCPPPDSPFPLWPPTPHGHLNFGHPAPSSIRNAQGTRDPPKPPPVRANENLKSFLHQY